jgi:hypothetical protein
MHVAAAAQAVGTCLLVFAVGTGLEQSMLSQTPSAIQQMASNEVAARQRAAHFAYTSEERSDRTGGRLWREHVVEVGDGVVRRLIAIDGRGLSSMETDAEARRLRSLADDPAEFRRLSQAHKDDEVHATAMLQLMSRAYTLTPDGDEGNCVRYRFVPNPAFLPASYEEKVAAAMAGTVSLKQPENRLCRLQGTLTHPVSFGFGLIGRVDGGGTFQLQRTPVQGGDWKTQKISVHLVGKILLMKSLAKEQETVRTEILEVPMDLSLAQGITILMNGYASSHL